MKKNIIWISIISLALIFLFFMFYLFPLYQAEVNDIAGKKVQSLDIRFSYTKHEVLQLFETVKEEGRGKIEFITGVVDMIYPLIYGMLLFLLITILTDNVVNNKLKTIRFLPLIVMLLDYVENSIILNMLNSYPEISEKEVLISSLATSLKWIFLIISILLIIVLIVIKIFKKNTSI